jgi:ADP-heptose:LPS heptosyltransferase
MAENINSILIIRYSSMGDVILTAPLLSVLRNKDPNAFIALLTRKEYGELFRDDSRLNKLYIPLKDNATFEPSLMDTSWDLVVDLQNNRRSSRLISNLRYTSLRRFDKLHGARLLLLLFRINRYSAFNSVAKRYISTSGMSFSEGMLDFSLHLDSSVGSAYAGRIQPDDIKRPVIALFPFTAWKNKEWGDKKFTEVGRFFIIKGWNVVLLGGEHEVQRARRLEKNIGDRCVSLAGELSLYECGMILKNCTLALGNDTGLTHLARACGIKTGFIFGPTTRHFGFYPEDDPHCRIFEQTHFCRPCHPHGGRFCWRVDHACMHTIKPAQVINGLMQLHEQR